MRTWLQARIRKKTRVYLRPTVAGLWWIGTLVILFLIGWGYSNNLCLALAVLILAITVLFLMEAHFNLDGLQLREIRVTDQFARYPAAVDVHWVSPQNRPRRLVKLKWDGSGVKNGVGTEAVFSGVGGHAQGTWIFPERGLKKFRHVILTSSYPLGLFQAWSYHSYAGSAWVYPSPLAGDVSSVGEEAESEHARMQASNEGEEPSEFRRYVDGDPPARVAWKVVARGLPPHSKTFEAPHTEKKLFRWPWGSGSEVERSQLAAAIFEAFQKGDPWALETLEHRFDWDSGPEHYQRCQRALAEAS
jgi:uncharacterized protein (DUF58 family)